MTCLPMDYKLPKDMAHVLYYFELINNPVFHAVQWVYKNNCQISFSGPQSKTVKAFYLSYHHQSNGSKFLEHAVHLMTLLQSGLCLEK